MGIKQAVTGRQGDRETDQGDNLWTRDNKGWMRCGWMGESDTAAGGASGQGSNNFKTFTRLL